MTTTTTPAAATAAAAPAAALSIALSPPEKRLKALLLDVARHIDSEWGDAKIKKEPVVLRWAGGWVRDRLLGLESHDIDTAINCMTGEDFSDRLRDYCAVSANRDRHGLGPRDLRHLHTVSRNPDKSKHLATTTTSLYGLDLDFVNLRKETYAADSRNPTMEFGTAEEDALRRDATINAMFYNLHTGQVEDLTSGLPDLAARLIRTPVDPLQTFRDDPLRVLRLVRFASRLDFTIDPDVGSVMSEPGVLASLRQKISRERVGVELEKMFKGNNPCQSLELIDRFRLYHAIFTNPNREDMPKPDVSNWRAAYQCLGFLERNRAPGSIFDRLVKDDETRAFAWALATLTPWEQLPDDVNPDPKKKPPPPLAAQAAREGFKAHNKLRDVVVAAHRNRSAIVALKEVVRTGQQPQVNDAAVFGMAIRVWDGAAGTHWRLQVLFAILVDVEMRCSAAEGVVGLLQQRDDVLAEWQQFLDKLVELDVVEAPAVKCIVEGRVLAQLLGSKPGKWMNPALDMVMAWQLRNPGVADYAPAVEEVRARAQELGIVRKG
ncbi:tRNA nucleotidyltransferase-like protein [Lasiosphaeria ovina]|uniref:tRNA nucleotidyltransferase-like protein n=1 Tax=Lasiosphaeria ovina TaxID=92902 RepID=A0AAE0NEP0_9PEZI|nr:tRNA nucleotidyltransferase-like protein [Lasiosphaeria ovina]